LAGMFLAFDKIGNETFERFEHATFAFCRGESYAAGE
jgi:hypothetical protein